MRVEEVSRRIKALGRWTRSSSTPTEWEDQFDGFSVGRYMVACHPDAPTVDHLMLATRLMVAENAVDDCYCEDHGGSPVGLGGRLLLAHTRSTRSTRRRSTQPAWPESLALGRAPPGVPLAPWSTSSARPPPRRPTATGTTWPGCTWGISRRPPGPRPATSRRCGSTWRCASSTTSGPAPPSPTPSAATNCPADLHAAAGHAAGHRARAATRPPSSTTCTRTPRNSTARACT